MYNYKLTEQDNKATKFQEERINAFSGLEDRIDNIKKIITPGKN